MTNLCNLADTIQRQEQIIDKPPVIDSVTKFTQGLSRMSN